MQVPKPSAGVSALEMSEYKDVFTGVGRLGEKYKIIIDENVPPVVNASRKVAFSLMDPLKTKL